MSRYSRRRFLQVGSAAAAAPLLPACAAAEAAVPGDGVPGPAPPPPASGGRLVEVDLTSAHLRTTLDGTPVRLRAYDGQIPGPLLEVRPGDRLRVTVRNRLDPYDSRGWTGDHNVPHALDTTNLHLHGLEIVPHLFEPVGTTVPTAEMIAVRPGEDYVYDFQIPADQPDGLFWYHPHHHGSTVVQAVTGMAGGLVVRGAVDEVLREAGITREEFLVFNDIGLFPSEREAGLWEYEPAQNAVWNTLESKVLRWQPTDPAHPRREPLAGTMVDAPELRGGFTTGDYKLRYYLVNGRPVYKETHRDAPSSEMLHPTGCAAGGIMAPAVPLGEAVEAGIPEIRVRPGEVFRLRLLNANSDCLMPVVVEGHEVHVIEYDGVNVPAPRRIGVRPTDQPWSGVLTYHYDGEPAGPGHNAAANNAQMVLAPANRVSALVRASATPGTYDVVQLAQCVQFLYSDTRVLARIVVEGDPIEMAIPDRLPVPSRHYPLVTDEEVTRVRQVTFSMAFPGVQNPIIGLDFLINNNNYDERSVATVVDVGTVEQWEVTVPDGSHGGSEGHPFHVHVNSFEVAEIGGVAQPPGTILDTVWTAPSTEVTLRQRFREWTGKSVYHCHILPHEDTGMMQNFLILPASAGTH